MHPSNAPRPMPRPSIDIPPPVPQPPPTIARQVWTPPVIIALVGLLFTALGGFVTAAQTWTMMDARITQLERDRDGARAFAAELRATREELARLKGALESRP